MTGSFAIDVRGLSKRFDGRIAVDDVSIRVPKGRIVGFLGPNGSGKTTTIRLLCGLLTPDHGTGTCLGFDLASQSEAIKRRVGYMTQKFSLYEDLSIRENLNFIASVYGLDRRRQRVDQALIDLGLANRQRQLAGQLSGGWKQRLALAACVLHQPELLLLDEPTAGVDPKARRDFWDHIHRLAMEGITVLVSTHYMDEAERCHDICYLAYGKVLAYGSTQSIVDGAGLFTWLVEGDGVGALAPALLGLPGIAMVAPFGNTLHVSGPDDIALEQAVMPFLNRADLRWTRAKPTLEDVFIHLMATAPKGTA